MFKSISWQQFITYFLLLLTLYYVLVALLYFKKDLKLILARNRSDFQPKPDTSSDPDEHDLFIVASSLKNAISEIISEGRDKSWIKEELLHALQRRIETDIKLRGTAFQPALNHHVQNLASNQCQIMLDEDDLRRLW